MEVNLLSSQSNMLSLRTSNYEPIRSDDSEFDELSLSYTKRASRRSYVHYLRRLPRLLAPRRLPFTLIAIASLVLIYTALFNPSYTNPPPFAIPQDERVFIAANIVDADLIQGAWGKAIGDLVDLIGPERTYVSVFGGPTEALQEFQKELPCNFSIVSEALQPIDLNTIPHVRLAAGEDRIKRIAYLAEVRNRALLPLDDLNVQFDKILFLNDVIFDPKEAARLLFATNTVSEREHGSGKTSTNYRAACAVDFISPFKFYDTFATRDLEGYGMGVPFFPYFADVGKAESRKDILAGKDSVRVKSCWGGMVAFDARFFQKRLPKPDNDAGDWKYKVSEGEEEDEGQYKGVEVPVKFRSDESTFWDASECCLIHADIEHYEPLKPPVNYTSPSDVGIFVNPYVRVAYDTKTFAWLPAVKRIERSFSPIHGMINWLASMPHNNPRREEIPGREVTELRWVYDGDGDGGKDAKGGRKDGFQLVDRVAGKGGFCGNRQLLVMREGVWAPGEKNWERLDVPLGA